MDTSESQPIPTEAAAPPAPAAGVTATADMAPSHTQEPATVISIPSSPTAAPLPPASVPSVAPTPSSPSLPVPPAASAALPTPAAVPAPAPASSHDIELQSAFEAIYTDVQQQCVGASSPSPPAAAPALSASSLRSLFAQLSSELSASRLLVARTQSRASHASSEVADLHAFLAQQVAPGASQRLAHLRSTFMDPGLARALARNTARAAETERASAERIETLLADSFRGESVTGRRLLARARRLVDENRGFEAQLSEARAPLVSQLAQLESSLSIQRLENTELHATNAELNDFLNELDKENGELTERIARLEAALKTARLASENKQREAVAREENEAPHATTSTDTPMLAPAEPSAPPATAAVAAPIEAASDTPPPLDKATDSTPS